MWRLRGLLQFIFLALVGVNGDPFGIENAFGDSSDVTLSIYFPHNSTFSFSQDIQSTLLQLVKSHTEPNAEASRWSLVDTSFYESGTTLTFYIKSSSQNLIFLSENVQKLEKNDQFHKLVKKEIPLQGNFFLNIPPVNLNSHKFRLQANHDITCCKCPPLINSTDNSTIHTNVTRCCTCTKNCGPVDMTYSDATSCLSAICCCGIIYVWYKFQHELPYQESLYNPKIWFCVALPIVWVAWVMSIAATSVPAWIHMQDTGTFNPWVFCPVHGSCISTTSLGCPVAGAHPIRNITTVRAFIILSVLALSVSAVFLTLGWLRREVAPVSRLFKIGVYCSFSAGCMEIIVWWLWLGYVGDVLDHYPGTITFGAGFYLTVVALGSSLVAAYFSAFGDQALINLLKKRKKAANSRSHAPSDARPLVSPTSGDSEGKTDGPASIAL